MIVKPHATHGLKTHEGTEKSTNQADQATEHRYRRRNDVGDDGVSGRATNPYCPVSLGVTRKVNRATKESHEKVLGGKVDEQGCADEQTGKSNTIADFLHDVTSGSKSWRRDIGSTEVVDHDSNRDIDSGHC